MAAVIVSDYFYGEESEQFSYFRIPRLLVRSKKFKTLSTDAKLLYGLMLDRMGLSAKHGWYDELGRVYIYYTLDEIQTDLMCGHNKAVRLLAELDTGKTGFRENYWAVTRICLPNGEKSYMIMNGLQKSIGKRALFPSVGILRTMTPLYKLHIDDTVIHADSATPLRAG